MLVSPATLAALRADYIDPDPGREAPDPRLVLGGSGVWETRGDHLVLEPRHNLAAWLTARVQLYTGGTQEWEIGLMVRHRGKEATLARGRAPTPRQAMRLLVDSLDPDTRQGRAGSWAFEILAMAVAWDLHNAEQRAQLGLLRKEGGL